MEKHYLLSEKDRESLRQLLAKERRNKAPSNNEEPRDQTQTPEVYIGLTSHEGIPALDESPGTATMGSLDIPGVGSCDIFRILPTSNEDSTEVMKYCGFSRTVYNLSQTAVPGVAWVLLAKEKFGSWIVTDVMESGSGGGTEFVGLTFTFDTDTAASDPGSGQFKGNNSTQPSSTKLLFSNLTLDSVSDVTLFSLLGGTGFIWLQQLDDRSKWQIWKWTNRPKLDSVGGSYYIFPVSHMASSISGFADGKTIYCLFASMTVGTVGPGGGMPYPSSDSDDIGTEVTFDSYRPFGGAANLTAADGTVYDDLYNGRGTSPLNTVAWTHYMDVAEGVDIIDGVTRTATLNSENYADGDEVCIPTGGSARYVVVWVTPKETSNGTVQRVYMMRHSL